MGIIEGIINKYYFYRTEILLIFYAISIIITLVGLIFFKVEGKNLRYHINKLIYKLIYSTIIVGIGQILHLLGLKPKIEYVHFNAAVFILLIAGIIAYAFLLCIMFKKIMLPIVQNCKYIQSVVYLELFLLSITQRLELLEWVTGTLGIISIEIFILILEKMISKQQDKKKVNEGVGYPNPNLYPTRRKQLEKFITVLEQQENEPYAVMVSGKWGAGKSSFIQALEKKLDVNSFIWVYAGSEKTVSEIMSDISIKILSVLKKNNVFIENKNSVEKYFLAFSDLLEDTVLKPLKKVSRVLTRGKNLDDRDYLNSKLDELNKSIYIIIDDLDRCDSEYQEKMFKVIRESMELHNCKTIFVVDKRKFLVEKYDANYIEKYISYTLDLSDVEYQEIVDYFIDVFFDDRFIQEMNKVILKNRSMKLFKEMVYSFPINLLEKLELSKENNSNINKKEEEIKKIQVKIEETENIISRIKENITISRKIVNYLKGIKRDINKLNNGIENISEEFLKEDWLEAIIKVQFVKNFMTEIFNNIKMSEDIYEFAQEHQAFPIDVVFDLHYDLLINNEKKETILNQLIYKIDTIDFDNIKTEEEKYHNEMDRDKMEVFNIYMYIEYAKNYDHLNKILSMYKDHDNISRESFINKIFELLCKRNSPFKVNTKEFLDFSKQFIACLKEMGLTDQDRRLCVSGGNSILRKAIIDNFIDFRKVLSVLFDITIIENNFQTLDVYGVNEFYEKLKKIDKNSRFMGLESEINKLLSIKTYYENLQVELKNEKYKSIGVDFERLFSVIKIIFEICEFWDGIEKVLNDSEIEESALMCERYFKFDHGYMYRIEVFDDVTILVKALKVLKKFYLSKENNYKSDYSLLLLRLSYRIVTQYEKDSAWFREKEKEIANLLMELSEVVCRLDRANDDIDEIKIYTYKFNEYCQNE